MHGLSASLFCGALQCLLHFSSGVRPRIVQGVRHCPQQDERVSQHVQFRRELRLLAAQQIFQVVHLDHSLTGCVAGFDQEFETLQTMHPVGARHVEFLETPFA